MGFFDWLKKKQPEQTVPTGQPARDLHPLRIAIRRILLAQMELASSYTGAH